MSSLTNEERLALDEIFLSMAVGNSSFFKVKSLFQNFSTALKENKHTKNFSRHTQRFTAFRPTRKTFLAARMIVRTGKQKLGKHLRSKL